MMATGTKFEASAVRNLMVVMLMMGVPSIAQQSCQSKTYECSNMLSTASLTISQHMQNATALEAACSSQKPKITECVKAAKSVCTDNNALSQLDMISGSLNSLCGAEAICRTKVGTCQLIMANAQGLDKQDPVATMQTMCGLYGQMSTCLDALDDECKKQEVAKNASIMVAQATQMCGGSSGGGATCQSEVLKCQMIMASVADQPSSANSDEQDPLEMMQKLCPIYGQVSACMKALDEDCKKQELAKNMSTMIAQGSQFCGGSSEGEVSCRSEVFKCQMIMASIADHTSSADSDEQNPFGMMQKLCPIYGQVSACMKALDEDCKKQNVARNMSATIAQGSQMCAGFSGDGRGCLGQLIKCQSKMPDVLSSLLSTGDGPEETDPFHMINMMQKACPTVLQMQSCLGRMTENCKDNPVVKNATDSMSKYNELCSGLGGGQQCSKLAECTNLLSSISPQISKLKHNATAVEVVCKPQRSAIRSCLDAGKEECKSDSEHKELDKMKSSFDEMCGPDSSGERLVAHTRFWTLVATIATMASLLHYF